MTETRCIRGGVVGGPPEETRRLLALVGGRLEEARAAGRPVLKLEPEDVERLRSEAGLENDAADAFAALIRQNLIRLRGRWREKRSAVAAPSTSSASPMRGYGCWRHTRGAARAWAVP